MTSSEQELREVLAKLSPEEQQTYNFLNGMDTRYRLTHEEIMKYILATRTQLWNELNCENFATSEWEYGYGGESVEVAATDHAALYEWIVARERRLLDGMTLEEFVDKKGSANGSPKA